MDMAFINAIERVDALPAARPVDGGRGPQLLLPRPPRHGVAVKLPGVAPGRRLQPRRRGAVRAHGGSVSRSRARCGRPLGAAAARAAGRSRPGWSPCVAAWRRSATSRACASGSTPAARRTTTTGSALARDPGHDQRVPVRSRSCSATCTRTCSRSRSRCSRSRSRCRSRSRARAATRVWRAVARGAGARRSRSARCTRSTRGRIPVARGLLVARWCAWLRDRAERARARLARSSGSARAARRASC